MTYPVIMSAVSALAIGNALFYGIYLLTFAKRNDVSRLLAFLLFALALRISKSVIVIAFPHASGVFPAIGLVGMAAIGPLTYLYVRAVFGRGVRVFDVVHFTPSLMIILTVAFISEDVLYYYYQAVVGHIFLYIVLSIYYVFDAGRVQALKKIVIRWLGLLLCGVFGIWLAFLYQLFADTFLSYIIATACAVVVLYMLGYWAMRQGKIFAQTVGPSSSSQELVSVAAAVDRLFVNEKFYLQNDVTLNSMAEQLSIPAYLISRAINEVHKQSFPDYLNSYRVEEAKARLRGHEGKIMSIEAIAYDSGFSTLSSFYAVFKKQVNMTPAAYRKSAGVS